MDKTGKYRNIKCIVYEGRRPEAAVKEQVKLHEKPVEPSNDLLDSIVEEGEEVMARCHMSVTLVLGRLPEKEGEPAMVNSLFIFVTREWKMRSK